MRRLLPFLIFNCSFLISTAQVFTYPAGEGVAVSHDYTVLVRPAEGGAWQPVSVYPVKVDEVKDARHHVRIASMAYFDFTGEVEVAVTCLTGGGGFLAAETSIGGKKAAAPGQVRVRPLSYAITPTAKGDTIFFRLDRPRNLSIEFGGDLFHNLHLFAGAPDTLRPAGIERMSAKRLAQRHLIYFPKGLHRLPGDTLRISSHTTVYIDGGARVVGQLIIDGAEDVAVRGRGEVHPDGRGEGVYVKRSRRVQIDGIIVTQAPVGQSDSVQITGVKSISSYGWGDGLNVFASSNVSYDHCFCRNSDDCSTVYATRKGFTGGCRNITMRRSTLWADVAHPIMIGLHGNVERPDTIEHVVYDDLDILDHAEPQIDYQGCFGISCGDENLVRDITFRNIRVEDFRQGQLVNLRIFYNKKYCLAPGRGIHGVLFKDITYNGTRAELGIIAGYDAQRAISDITFDNLRINGLHISDDMPEKPKWWKAADMARIFVGEHVSGVVFK